MNGKYLKGLEQMNANPFQPIELNYERRNEVMDYVKNELSPEQKERLSSLFKAIEGFESTLSLEILSSTHYMLKTNPQLPKDALIEKVQWNERKQELIKPEYVELAYQHLKQHGQQFQLR